MKIGWRSAKALSLIGAIALLWGCEPTPTRDRQRPQVVATTAVLCDLAQQIGRDSIDLTCLLKPDQDPHVYTPTPADRRAIEAAQLLLYGGYGYEPSLLRMVQATQSAAPKLAVYETAVPNPLLSQGHDHDPDHAEDKTAAPNHAADPTPDPHVWHEARNGIAIAQVVAKALSDLQPAEAATYQQREQAIAAQLQQIQAWIPQQIATIPAKQRRLITTHNSFGYYARAYGLTEAGAIAGLSTQEQPTPTRLTELVKTLRAAQVPTVFRETTSNPRLIGTVAQAAGVQLFAQPLYVEGPGGPDSPAPHYQQMLIHNTCAIATGLGGRCQPLRF